MPYRGSAPAVVDLIAGQIPLASVDLTSAYPHIQAGRLIALGLLDAKRFAAAPEIPTIAEGGVAGFGRDSGFIGLFAPIGTPAALVKRLSRRPGEREVRWMHCLSGTPTDDDGVQAADALGHADVSVAEIAALRAHVGRLEDEVARLRDRFDKLTRDLGVST